MADDSENMREMDCDQENESSMNCEQNEIDDSHDTADMNIKEEEEDCETEANTNNIDDVTADDTADDTVDDSVDDTADDTANEPHTTTDMEAQEQSDPVAGVQQGKKGRPFIPSQLEFKYERTREQQERTLIAGPATLDDLFQSKLKEYMPHSEQFYIRYLYGDVPKTESTEENSEESLSNGEAPRKEHRGLIEVRFSSIEQAEEAVEDLSGLHDDLIVKRITYEYSQTQEFKQLKKIGQPYENDGLDGFAMKRLVGMIGIDESVNMESIKEKMPEVVDVMFPYDYKKVERRSYCYLELKAAEDLKTYVDKTVNIDDKEFTIVALEEIPPLEVLTKKLDRETIPDYLQFPLDKNKKDRIRLLLRQTNHHKRLDGISDAKLEMIKKKTQRFDVILKQDFQLRRGRGRGRGRGDHRGGRGSMRGSAPPPHYNYYQQQQQQGYGRYDGGYDDYYSYDRRQRGVHDRMPRPYGYGGGPPPNKRRMNDNYWY